MNLQTNCYIIDRSRCCCQWCSGSGATGAIAPVPIFQGGALLPFLLLLSKFNLIFDNEDGTFPKKF